LKEAVRKHRADHAANGFACRGRFVAMFFYNLGGKHSLRETCGGTAASDIMAAKCVRFDRGTILVLREAKG
jgi:hypothetical protein